MSELPSSLPEAHRRGWTVRDPLSAGGRYSARHDAYGVVSAGSRAELLEEVRKATARWVPPAPPVVVERAVSPERPRKPLVGWARYPAAGSRTEVVPPD